MTAGSPVGASLRGRSVLVTGDTGFKGSWLCEWLLGLGADVSGAALPAETEHALFRVLDLARRVAHVDADLRDRTAVHHLVQEVKPDVVIHLAGQALVRRSYREPLLTLDTNVTGTANLLAAVGAAGYTPSSPCAVVVVTTDKCYANGGETSNPFVEGDALGGSDVYSASKGMVELLAASWRTSFFAAHGAVRLATARAGNVIGGGDLGEDRLVPDAVRAIARGEPLLVRHPDSLRPWQHVLEPLSGYLLLAERLLQDDACASTWNFGPGPEGERTVAELCQGFVECWGAGAWQAVADPSGPRETTTIRLSIAKTRTMLGWRPTWGFEAAVMATVLWYRRALECGHDGAVLRDLTRQQIECFVADSAHGRLAATPAGTASSTTAYETGRT